MQLGQPGLRDGRATALSVVLPLRTGGLFYYLVVLRFFDLPRVRRRAFRDVDGLRFVSAIRWSLVPAMEEVRGTRWSKWFGRRVERRSLLFESNFDGDWDDYLDSFALAATRSIKVILWGARGYPGLDDPAIFKSYARARDHVPDYYMSAYPRSTASDLRHALRVDDPGHRERIVASSFGKAEPQWSTVLLPIKTGRTGAAIAAARDLAALPIGHDPFLGTTRVHFARIFVHSTPEVDWLFLTMTHDGPLDTLAPSLVNSELIRHLLAQTDGAPDDISMMSPAGWSRLQWQRHVTGSVPRWSREALAYTAFGSITCAELRNVLDNGRASTQWPEWEGQE